MVGKHQLAMESLHLEQEILKEAVGSQDQVLAAYGGLNHVLFHANGEISVRPVTISPTRVEQLSAHLMLFYTGIKRTASTVAETVINGFDDRKRQLRIINELVNEGLAVLSSDASLEQFGDLLHQAWELKRTLGVAVSNGEVDALYARARSAGAIGGKLAGAGGGGFLLIFAKPEKHDDIRRELSELIYVPVEITQSGSRIIYYEPEKDYSMIERSRASQQIKAFRELSEGNDAGLIVRDALL
jgi:D-glycero-alpha-D-manno-heptose-7-phosphate kinase